MTPPDDSDWIQSSTFLGGFGVTVGAEEGGDGSNGPEGLPGPQLSLPPDQRTAVTFGFVRPKDFPDPGATGSISGVARNWVGYPPYDNLVMREPVPNPIIALSNTAADQQVYTGRGDAEGNFSIPNVPAGTYVLSIWDEQLNYIMRLLTVTVVADGEQVDLGDIGVARWFGWLAGYVYHDEGVAENGATIPGGDGNSIRDCLDEFDPETCERGIGGLTVDQRWRDGSIKHETFTDPFGRYEYPQVEGGNVGKFFIGEVGFTQFATTGPSLHDELDYSIVEPVPQNLGGGLLTNQYAIEGHRSEVDWGKQTYPQGTPGQIVGIVLWGTTRNELEAQLQAHEVYEPGIPDVTVRLESTAQFGPDGKLGTSDDPPWNPAWVLNEYVTDHWQGPQDCDLTDAFGDPVTDLNPFIAPRCLEVPVLGNETKDGGFDGGYAFADYCPVATGGYNSTTEACGNGSDPVALVPGDYVTHVVMPEDAAGDPLYKIVAEEDVNVDLGMEFEPAIPPPPCAGNVHIVQAVDTNPRGAALVGQERALCDKKLIDLNAQQNANADFTLMTNFVTGPDIQLPGRILGLASNNLTFDGDKQSIWYGEAAPIAHIPVGIRDYKGRLLTTVSTDENGVYEAIVPSLETFNCPIPQGPCPGMYRVVVNDPGDAANPNQNYNPDFQSNVIVDAVWPGQTTQLDTPVRPISANGCQLPLDTPELLQVSRALVRPNTAGNDNTAALRRITLDGDFFGTAPGSVTLTDPRGVLQSRTFSGLATATQLANLNTGGIVSWTNRRIVLQVPAPQLLFLPGQKQLSVQTAGAAGVPTPNAITLHVLGTFLGSTYNPAVVNAGAPASNPHALQNAINAANLMAVGPGATPPLVLLQPGAYRENVVISKRILLQGRGPGGAAGTNEPANRPPDDPRFAIEGTTINGGFFADNEAFWDTTVNGIAGRVDPTRPVLRGAAVTVVARTAFPYDAIGTGATNVFNAARIDGIGITGGRGEGAGGIQLQAQARNLQISNDVLENDGGIFAGGIGIGQPYYNAQNTNVRIAFTRVVGSGGLARAGGVGIFRGSNGYEIANSILCSNYGAEYGGGISHWGLSPNGSIHDNRIYYNESFDSAGGILISQELPLNPAVLGDGSGTVDIDRNLIQGNNSGDDGGGIFVMNAHGARINIRNNLIVANLAADIGGGIALDDSSNVFIANTTVASNATSGSVQTTDGQPHAAGLASHANSPLFQATPASAGKRFSDPVLVNDIFWQNEAFTVSSHAVDATLISAGFLDFEVNGTCAASPSACQNDRFTPRYSLMTNGQIRLSNGGTAVIPGGGAPIVGFPTNPVQNGNITGVDPLFVAPITLELAIIGSRLDPQFGSVTITNFDPPVGLPGNYHLQTPLASNQVSGAVDRGVRCSNTPVPPPLNPLTACTGGGIEAPTALTDADIDGQGRPQLRTLRARTPWDLGADEVPTLAPAS